MLKIVDISSLPHMTLLELGRWVFEETLQWRFMWQFEYGFYP